MKDIASHLLDGSLRRLSFQRDRYAPVHPRSGPQSGESLLDFLTRLNLEWEAATRRLSPPVLIELIEWADAQLARLFQSLDPEAPAPFPVAWTGDQSSPNWMDIAREYTEKWHHTQQIFAATNRPSTITTRDLFHPCLETFMRALPFAFRDVEAELGTAVVVEVTGEPGQRWSIERCAGGWQQVSDPSPIVRATVKLDPLTTWKLVTKRHDRGTVRSQFPTIEIVGDKQLGSHVLDMVSMMA